MVFDKDYKEFAQVIHEFWLPFNLSVRAHNVLVRARVATLQELNQALLEGEYLQWKNCGLKVREELYTFNNRKDIRELRK